MLGGQRVSAPMKLRASLHETIWGGQRLRELAGKDAPADVPIGESWETAVDAVVREGPHSGETLGAIVERYGAEFLGSRAVVTYGVRFPLLAKFIDAQQWLSVQVHPDDSYAAEHEGGKLGKTEAWYILDAAPGAQVVYGVRRTVSRDEIRLAVEEARLEELLLSVDVEAGDVVYVPAGTVHAIGAGVALFELQEYSDITYRLYDYGRIQANGQPRELHIERALDVTHCEPPATVKARRVEVRNDDVVELRALVACDYFVEEELRLSGAFEGSVTGASLHILTVLGGGGELDAPNVPPMLLRLGDTLVLPAGMGAYTITGDLRIIRAYVPDADDPTVASWRAAQASQPSNT